MLENLHGKDQNKGFTEDGLPENPLVMFRTWFDNSVAAGIPDPTAMVISTVSPAGIPSSRTVLLKEINDSGLIFYSNYNSRKAKEIELNENICSVFLWLELERQVRIEGKAAKISKEQSDEYFSGRPRESQIGAWASPQSKKISSRKELDELYRSVEHKFEGNKIPRPPHWGGYIILPVRIEFWQGRPGRMHDRIVYEFQNEKWITGRLAP